MKPTFTDGIADEAMYERLPSKGQPRSRSHTPPAAAVDGILTDLYSMQSLIPEALFLSTRELASSSTQPGPDRRSSFTSTSTSPSTSGRASRSADDYTRRTSFSCNGATVSEPISRSSPMCTSPSRCYAQSEPEAHESASGAEDLSVEEARKARARAYRRRYYQHNKERELAQQRHHRHVIKDVVAARNRAYRNTEHGKERQKAANKRWREKRRLGRQHSSQSADESASASRPSSGSIESRPTPNPRQSSVVKQLLEDHEQQAERNAREQARYAAEQAQQLAAFQAEQQAVAENLQSQAMPQRLVYIEEALRARELERQRRAQISHH